MRGAGKAPRPIKSGVFPGALAAKTLCRPAEKRGENEKNRNSDRPWPTAVPVVTWCYTATRSLVVLIIKSPIWHSDVCIWCPPDFHIREGVRLRPALGTISHRQSRPDSDRSVRPYGILCVYDRLTEGPTLSPLYGAFGRAEATSVRGEWGKGYGPDKTRHKQGRWRASLALLRGYPLFRETPGESSGTSCGCAPVQTPYSQRLLITSAINSRLPLPALASPCPLPEGVKVTSPSLTSRSTPLSL